MNLKFALIVAGLLAGTAACTTAGQSDLSGMSFSDQPLTGKVIWNDLVTDDFEAAKRFYGGLFDWTFSPARRMDGGDYVVARNGNVFVAGILGVDARPDGKDVSRWLPYLSVADVDGAVARSMSGGATVAVSARDVNLGRVAAIIDPEGAVIGLATSDIGDPDDSTTRVAPGRVVWSELLSGDPAAAAQFYSLLAGFDVEVVERRGGQYTFLNAQGVNRAGVMAMPADDIEPVWLTYFGVDDPQRAAAKAKELGGTIVLSPSPDVREGTMAVVTDPAGAVLVLQKVPM
jgi:predicted enzyme related to lactoylglutathione lyase